MAVYQVTEDFPQKELYGLVSQMRRAAVSIPSNIAEGKMRGTDNEFRRYLSIAYGSCAELETQVEIAKRLPETKSLSYLSIDGFTQEVGKMMNRLIDQLTPEA